MARMRRLKYRDPRDGYYHVISRTVLKSFLLDDNAREKFVSILRKLSRVYFVKVVTFAVMSNHFHLVVRMLPREDFSDEEVEKRFKIYYNEGKVKEECRIFPIHEAEDYRRRFGDLSCFVQDLKQRFSRWHNKRSQNQGHVWSDRFKNLMLEGGRALLDCMIYVELNSVRAGLVERPEDYPYSGLNHLVTGGRAAAWLDRETLKQVLELDLGESVAALSTPAEQTVSQETQKSNRNEVKRYLALVYEVGLIAKAGAGQIASRTGEQALATDFTEVGIFSLRRRWRHFSAGVFVGSKEFCTQRFAEFRSFFRTKKERQGQRIAPKRAIAPGGLLDLYALRKLR